MALKGKDNAEKIWNYFKSKKLNDYAVAGLMGNLKAESNLNPHNLQNNGKTNLGVSDDEFVKMVDNGEYSREEFIKDKYGFGIAQHTYWTRKEKLYDFAQAEGKSIGDLEMQLDFLYKELTTNYKSVMNALKRATSVREASDVVLLKFEKPKNQSESVQEKRAEYGQEYYDKYAVSIVKKVKEVKEKNVKLAYEKPQVFKGSVRGIYKTTANLRLRKGAGTDKELIIVIPEGSNIVASGWYSYVNSTKWFLVTYGNDTGFCSSDYLKRT